MPRFSGRNANCAAEARDFRRNQAKLQQNLRRNSIDSETIDSLLLINVNDTLCHLDERVPREKALLVDVIGALGAHLGLGRRADQQSGRFRVVELELLIAETFDGYLAWLPLVDLLPWAYGGSAFTFYASNFGQK